MKQIIEHFGSKVALAKALGVKKPAVSWWLRYGLPAEKAVEIEKLTDGKFKAVNFAGAKGDTHD